VEVYVEPNYNAGPFFSELLLKNPRAKKERWKKTTEDRRREKSNKRKKEQVRFLLWTHFTVYRREEGKPFWASKDREMQLLYCSEDKTVKMSVTEIGAYGEWIKIILNGKEIIRDEFNHIIVNRDHLMWFGIKFEYPAQDPNKAVMYNP
jgi:hypothetical protein